ncbi:MAG: dienelactone hydrolase family protein [Pigmentiphaga sp.]|nr:dienelactone hydrolase family protein [Pigmentiphaga sp.]
MSFAKATGQPATTTISTPADGLRSGKPTIDTAAGAIPAYYAAPQAEKPPIVLVVQELFGLHEHIQDVCRRLARGGYFAIAPDLYFRQGDPANYDDIPTLVKEVANRVPDDQVLSDLDAAARWATAQGGDPARLAVTGFCWGGRITWLYAAHNPALKAAVAWYGRLQGPADPLRPRQPIDVVGALQAPVLGLYGGEDTGIPVSSVEAMREALATGNAPAQASAIHLYPEAPHAFYADYRPSYRPGPAEDGWRRMLSWFEARL